MTEALTLRDCPSCGCPKPLFQERGRFYYCPVCHLCGPDLDDDAARWNRLPRRSDILKSFIGFAAWSEGAQKRACIVLLSNTVAEFESLSSPMPIEITSARQYCECTPHALPFIRALAGGHPEAPDTWSALLAAVKLQLFADLTKGA